MIFGGAGRGHWQPESARSLSLLQGDMLRLSAKLFELVLWVGVCIVWSLLTVTIPTHINSIH